MIRTLPQGRTVPGTGTGRFNLGLKDAIPSGLAGKSKAQGPRTKGQSRTAASWPGRVRRIAAPCPSSRADMTPPSWTSTPRKTVPLHARGYDSVGYAPPLPGPKVSRFERVLRGPQRLIHPADLGSSARLQRFAILPPERAWPANLIIGCARPPGLPTRKTQCQLAPCPISRQWSLPGPPSGREWAFPLPPAISDPSLPGWRGNSVAPATSRCGSHGGQPTWEPHRGPSRQSPDHRRDWNGAGTGRRAEGGLSLCQGSLQTCWRRSIANFCNQALELTLLTFRPHRDRPNPKSAGLA